MSKITTYEQALAKFGRDTAWRWERNRIIRRLKELEPGQRLPASLSYQALGGLVRELKNDDALARDVMVVQDGGYSFAHRP